MSFSTDIKNEASRVDSTKEEFIAELSGIIRNSGVIQNDLKINVENNIVARKIFTLLKDLYDITPVITVRKKYFTNGLSYILTVSHKKEQVLEDLSITSHGEYLNIPKEYIYSDEDLTRAYLRGVFLVTGSINDPKTSRYHLEILVNNEEYAKFINDILNSYNLNSKILKRESKYMIYIKEAEKIGDFLRLIGTTKSLLYYEDIRIYRDHVNMTNRLNNCEQANVDKIIQTAEQQIKDIELIQKYGLDLLSEKEQLAANDRLKYKDASLQELSEIITIETQTKITKPGLHHRFDKIKKLAQRIREKENKNE